MKPKKISLRIHIFLAFFIVFLLSFTLIIGAFNIIVQSYIQNDAKNKIMQSIKSAQQLAADGGDSNGPAIQHADESASDLIVRKIIRPLTNNSEVFAALLSDRYGIEYPSASGSMREIATVKSIAEELRNKDLSLADSSVRVIRISDKTILYVSSIPITVNVVNSFTPSSPKYLILYYDASPIIQFSERVNIILLFIMFVALFLSLLTSLLVSNSIIKSTRMLTAFASKIGSGVFRRENFNFFDRELDTLATDMNIMADKLDQADKEQKTFFQNASHELRTPLMSIQGYAEGIRYSVFDDEKAAADIIISESQRLTGMVENLLTISRMDTAATGGQNIQKQIFDFKELMESVVEKMRGSALHAQKNISVRGPDEDIHVLGNENDLFRAFENILSNGLRYAASNVDITIRTVSESGQVSVMITDDGTGISEELLPHVFDRFSLGENGKHGIGLALVKAIILEHKGTVTAANRPDGIKGAVFTVTLNTVKTDSVIKDYN